MNVQADGGQYNGRQNMLSRRLWKSPWHMETTILFRILLPIAWQCLLHFPQPFPLGSHSILEHLTRVPLDDAQPKSAICIWQCVTER